jgi:hypothetical protein
MGLLQTLQTKSARELSAKERKVLLKKIHDICEGEDMQKKRALLSIILEYYQQKNEIDYEHSLVPGIKVKSDTDIRIDIIPDELLPCLQRFVDLNIEESS